MPTFSPDGQHLLYGSNADGQLKRVAVEGGTPQMVLPEYQGGGWDWTDAETIHYSANFEDQCRIFELAATGGEPSPIAEVNGFNCYEPSLLPGGEYLLYWQRRPTDVANVEVVVQSLATGDVIPLFPGRQPIYLEPYLIYFDATLGLMARAFDPEDLNYGNSVPLVENILPVNQVSSAQLRVGDNGESIYIEDDTAGVELGIPLSVVDRNGSIRRLNVPLDNNRFPALSRNGDRVAVQINRETGSQNFIYDLEGDGGINQLTFEGSNTRPTWSPDGEWVISSSDRGDGTIRLWRKLSNLRGEAEPLTDPEEGHMHDTAAFTADGARLAFSDTIRGDDAGWPVWSKDSQRIYYAEYGSGEFVSVDVDASSSAWSNRRKLGLRGSPGQRRLETMPSGDDALLLSIAVQATDGPSTFGRRIVIVENWIEEIKRRVREPR